MPHIKEPYGIDFTVENTPVSQADRKLLSDIIAHYKATGKVKKIEPKIGRSITNKRPMKRVLKNKEA